MSESVTDAIVLARLDYGDSDWIVTLLSRDGGLIKGLARAARKSRKRFGAGLMSFTVSRVELRRRGSSELWTLLSAQPIESFAAIAADVVGLAHASYASELVRELVAVEVAEPDIFELLASMLRTVERRGAHPPMLRVFELHLLRHLGLEPDFGRCGECGAQDAELDDGAVFDSGRGVVLCRACASRARGYGVRPLSAQTRRILLRAAEATELEQAYHWDAGEDGASGARDLMIGILTAQVGHPLKSLEFAAQLRDPRR